MAGWEFLVAFAGAGSFFVAAILIGYELLKKHKKDSEHFSRNHIEDAMRIKARQYREKD